MAATFVQSTYNTTVAGTNVATIAFGSNTVVGNAILVAVYWDATEATFSSVTDSKGNAYTPIGSAFVDANTQGVQHAYCLNIGTAGASHTVTLNLSVGAGYVRIIAHEVSGLLASDALDQASGGKQQTNTSVTDDAVVPTNNGQYIFASCMNDGGTVNNVLTAVGLTKPANSTSAAASNEAIAAYLVQTTAASFSSAFTRANSGSCLMRTSTFKAAGGAGTDALESSSLLVAVPLLTAATVAQTTLFALGDYTLDAGLDAARTLADKIYVCSSTPTSFNEATLAPGSGGYALGSKNFGVGAVFGAIAAGSPAGRKITSNAVTNGSIATNGTVLCWAVVDSVNSRLLAKGPLSGGTAVTVGQGFTLDAITLHTNP